MRTEQVSEVLLRAMNLTLANALYNLKFCIQRIELSIVYFKHALRKRKNQQNKRDHQALEIMGRGSMLSRWQAVVLPITIMQITAARQVQGHVSLPMNDRWEQA